MSNDCKILGAPTSHMHVRWSAYLLDLVYIWSQLSKTRPYILRNCGGFLCLSLWFNAKTTHTWCQCVREQGFFVENKTVLLSILMFRSFMDCGHWNSRLGAYAWCYHLCFFLCGCLINMSLFLVHKTGVDVIADSRSLFLFRSWSCEHSQLTSCRKWG